MSAKRCEKESRNVMKNDNEWFFSRHFLFYIVICQELFELYILAGR